MAELSLRGSFVTILGQTAATAGGEGMTITGEQFTINKCHDVIIRYLRFKSGVNTGGRFHCQRSLVILGKEKPSDPITYNVILDHCSIGASQDDDISIWGGVCHITVQNCIIAGGVYPHCKAGVVGGLGSIYTTEGITICHNLIANTDFRQLDFTGKERIDFYNNVVATGNRGSRVYSLDGTNGPRINYLYNWFRSASTPDVFTAPYYIDPIRALETSSTCQAPCSALYVPNNHESIWLEGNRFQRHILGSTPAAWNEPYSSQPQWKLTIQFNADFEQQTDLNSALEAEERFDISEFYQNGDMYVTPNQPSEMEEEVYDSVRDDAGCRLPLSSPALQSCTSSSIYHPCDQQIADAVVSGSRIWFMDDLHDMKPEEADTPAPTHGNTSVPLNQVTLSWKQHEETEFFKVYFKTGTPDQRNAYHEILSHVNGVAPDEIITVNIPADFVPDFLPLEPGSPYSWRVDAYNGCWYDATIGPTIGTAWTFTTVSQ